MPAQLSIFLDTEGNPRAEAPGLNGSRVKIDLPMDFAQRNPEIMAALLEQLDVERARETARLQALRKSNIQYVDQRHRNLAPRIWGKAEFELALTRKTSASATRETPTNAQRKPVLSADALDI